MSATNAAAPARKKHAVRDIIAALVRPKVAIMLALGFASGLPFLLTGNTLGYWLRDEGTTLTAIGFISWVGIAYSLKFLWAPIIDRASAPLLGRFGRRRSWLVLSQLLVGVGLIGMSVIGPDGPGGLALLGALALVVAFASATQDIVVDAWRIEAADDGDELGLLSATYQLGYRIALIVTDALILIAAEHLGWPISYVLMAAAMSVGLFATLKAAEPARAEAVMDSKAQTASLWTLRGFIDAVIGPFIQFFRDHGVLALLMLVMISLYRLPEFMMGPMSNPFYHDLGLSRDTVGIVRVAAGLTASLAGIAAGGLCAIRFGYLRTLVIGAIVQSLGVLTFSALALAGPNIYVFSAVMAIESFAASVAGVALVTYMSSLTSLGYTATQYALMSSTYAMLGKFLKGFSGVIVDGLAKSVTLMEAYAIFFALAAAIGLPALALCIILIDRTKKLERARNVVPAPKAANST